MIKPVKRMFTLCSLISLLGLTSTVLTGLMAEPIYKSIDAQGNVTYSSEPAKDADTVKDVEIQPGPSEAAQEAGRERARQMESSAAEISGANVKRVQDNEIKEETKENEVDPVESYNRVSDDYRKNVPVRPSRPIARPLPSVPGGGRGR